MTLKMTYSGIVIQGLQNGRTFGFPTANIVLDEGNICPSAGVYAVSVFLLNQELKGMLYVGTRPTLDLQTTTIEIHLFDFEGDIYHKKLTFTIEKKIREEKKFATVQQLIEQLKKDKEQIINYFNV